MTNQNPSLWQRIIGKFSPIEQPQVSEAGLVVDPSHFIYFRLRRKWIGGDYGGITAALKLEPTGAKVALSFCSPDDNFCKATGRDLATERLADFPYDLAIKDGDPKLAKFAVRTLVKRLLKRKSGVKLPYSTPSWMRKAKL